MDENKQINSEEQKYLGERIRFKSLPYDKEDNYQRLCQRLERTPAISFKDKNVRIWKYISVAASLALLIVSGLYLFSIKPAQELAWYETTAVPDAKTKVTLPDNSAVWLNANATLFYPHQFNGDVREVEMSGEAFFEVKKGKKPFIVQLGGLHIKVLGTSFNVINNRNSDEIIVTLLNGRVALYSDKRKSDTPEEILYPGQQAVYSKSHRNIVISDIRPEAVTSWVTGVFRFEENTLEEITRELERAFHVKIHIENEMLRQKTFNAIFDEKETLDEILSILQISARYTIDRRKGEIYIY